ncbi:hypothetical protein ASG67_08225 [Sphingomonas sp. Leaf339]|nr:hypothetical protein ASG67_08225 [Sphingomonas sp. Leaf339]
MVSDRKAFIIAIRAFALAGKLGDHLTVIGYGPHRRCLKKWAVMLGIDAIMTFAEADFSGVADLTAYDVVIGMPRYADWQPDFRETSFSKVSALYQSGWQGPLLIS